MTTVDHYLKRVANSSQRNRLELATLFCACLMPVGAERALSLFLLSSCKCLAPRVISQPTCVAKNATLLVRLMPVGAERALSLFLLSSCKCLASRVISQPTCVAKNATLLVCLMPVGAEQALSLFLFN